MMMLEQKLHAVLYGNECPICKSSAVKDKLGEQEAELVRMREALKKSIDLAEFWINREDTRDYSEGAYRTWLALGHQSKTMMEIKAALAGKLE